MLVENKLTHEQYEITQLQYDAMQPVFRAKFKVLDASPDISSKLFIANTDEIKVLKLQGEPEKKIEIKIPVKKQIKK